MIWLPTAPSTRAHVQLSGSRHITVYPMAAMIDTADQHSWVQPPGSSFGQRQATEAAFVAHAIEEIRPRGICCVGASVQARSCAVQLAAFKVWVELRYPPENRVNTSRRVEVVVLSEKDIEEKP